MPMHGQKSPGHRGGSAMVVVVVMLAIVLVIAVAGAIVLVLRPPAAADLLAKVGVASISAPERSSDPVEGDASFSGVVDITPSEDEAAVLEEQSRRAQRTPYIARCAGVELCSPVNSLDITGVLFHQASFDYALPLETELPQADYETVADTRTMRVNHDQKASTEDWLDADALHLWRTTDETEMDTSIDVGAYPGTTVLAPVSGTVVLVRDYLLYNEMPDIEIHIQPDGRPDLDCVLIHTSDAMVKAGDRVQAGLTPIAKVRNIEEFLTDVQLGFFLPEGTGGNHTHIQVNNTDYPGYREKKLEGAVSAS